MLHVLKRPIYRPILLFLCLLMLLPAPISHAQESQDSITEIFWNHDGSKLALIYHYGRLEIRDGETLDLLYTNSDRHEIRNLAWSPNNEWLAFAELSLEVSYDIVIINTLTYETEKRLFLGDYHIIDFAWSPDGTKIAANSQRGYGQNADKYIDVWDITATPPENLLSVGYPMNSLTWSPDGEQLLLSHPDAVTVILDSHTLLYIDGFDYAASALAWSPDGKLIALLNDDGLTIWDAATYNPLKTFSTNAIYYSMRWSPDSQTLVAKNSDDQFEFWDIASGQLYATLEGEGFNAIAWHPDGTKIAHTVNYTDFVVVDAPTFNPATE